MVLNQSDCDAACIARYAVSMIGGNSVEPDEMVGSA